MVVMVTIRYFLVLYLRRNSKASLPFSTAGFFFVAGVDLLAAGLFCVVLLAAGLFLTSLVVS